MNRAAAASQKEVPRVESWLDKGSLKMEFVCCMEVTLVNIQDVKTFLLHSAALRYRLFDNSKMFDILTLRRG